MRGVVAQVEPGVGSTAMGKQGYAERLPIQVAPR
jgi:hypothetical protein